MVPQDDVVPPPVRLHPRVVARLGQRVAVRVSHEGCVGATNEIIIIMAVHLYPRGLWPGLAMWPLHVTAAIWGR